MTTWLESFLLVAVPYAAIAVLATGLALRKLRSLPVVAPPASSFLEPRAHFRATGTLHFGLAAVLAVHVVALAVPWPLRWWNASPYRLLALELALLGAGMAVAGAACFLLWRRLSLPRLRGGRRHIDTVVAGLLVVQSLTGVSTAVLAPWGTAWMTWAASPYLASLLRLDPAVAYLASAPWTLKLHFVNAMLLLALLPFTSLSHAFLFPLRWFRRPPLVFRSRRRTAHG